MKWYSLHMEPDPEHPNTIWFNISVEDIRKTRESVLANICIEIQPIAEMMDGAISNSFFVGPFGYMWSCIRFIRC